MTAPIIITAQMGKSDQGWANALRRAHFPPERNHLDAHITLFHHLPPTQLPEIKSRLAALAREYPPPPAMLSEVMHLGRGVATGSIAPIYWRCVRNWQRALPGC